MNVNTVQRQRRWVSYDSGVHYDLIYETLKKFSYLNSEGMFTSESGSNKKCFWVIFPVWVLMVTTGKPICRIQRFMITSTECGSFMPALSTAWLQEHSNISNSMTLPCFLQRNYFTSDKHFRGQLHQCILLTNVLIHVFLHGVMTCNHLLYLRTDSTVDYWPLSQNE